MCRSESEGGRRCPGSHARSASPPADGKTRVEIHTNKRSYVVIGGGDSRVVPWLPGEKVESIEPISQQGAS